MRAWSKDTPDGASAPLAGGGKFFVNTPNQGMIAIDSTTGSAPVVVGFNGLMPKQLPAGTLVPAPATDGRYVAAAAPDGNVWVVENTKTELEPGEHTWKWKAPTGISGDISSGSGRFYLIAGPNALPARSGNQNGHERARCCRRSSLLCRRCFILRTDEGHDHRALDRQTNAARLVQYAEWYVYHRYVCLAGCRPARRCNSEWCLVRPDVRDTKNTLDHSHSGRNCRPEQCAERSCSRKSHRLLYLKHPEPSQQSMQTRVSFVVSFLNRLRSQLLRWLKAARSTLDVPTLRRT